MSSLEKKIKEKKEYINRFVSMEEINMNDELKDLRHLTVSVHYLAEIIINDAIAKHATGYIELHLALHKEEDKDLLYITRGEIIDILDEIEILRKIKILNKMLLIEQKSDKIEGSLKELDKLRVFFSHPASFSRELDKYKDRTKYLEALDMITRAADAAVFLLKKMSDRIENIKKNPQSLNKVFKGL